MNGVDEAGVLYAVIESDDGAVVVPDIDVKCDSKTVQLNDMVNYTWGKKELIGRIMLVKGKQCVSPDILIWTLR